MILFDKMLLDEEEAVQRGLLTVTKFLEVKELKQLVSFEYHSYINLYGKALVQKLSPHHSFEYQICIKEGKEVPFKPSYHLWEKELEALKEYLDGMLKQEKIM
jgi:hypothetical protein